MIGNVTSVAGEAHDRDGGQHAGHCQHGQGLPPGSRTESQPAGQALVHLMLNPVDRSKNQEANERSTPISGEDKQDR